LPHRWPDGGISLDTGNRDEQAALGPHHTTCISYGLRNLAITLAHIEHPVEQQVELSLAA
jgi:hypothetical protein